RDAACDQIGSMIASDFPLKNLGTLSEQAAPPLKNPALEFDLKRDKVPPCRDSSITEIKQKIRIRPGGNPPRPVRRQIIRGVERRLDHMSHF
ncbi:hypothetical protein, partial [Burkholderia cenocepacia]|uniref:hypothetical protein n=1 Tax=Burkholderia cenocepacia TaxID=95486 RepID=UPI001ABA4A53